MTLDDQPIALPPKALDALILLVQSPGHLITKEEFLDIVWSESIVEESTLTRTISILRKALEDGGARDCIETVPKSGYRFAGAVRVLDETGIPGSNSATAGDVPKAEAPVPRSRGGPGRFVSRPILLLTGLFVIVGGIALTSSWNRNRSGPDDLRSIAVVPFAHLGSGAPDELLETAMADTLITRLSGIPGIAVRPTSSVLRYADSGKEPSEIGRELGVDAVLAGSIQQAGSRLRVNVQLIGTERGDTLWAENFDTEASDLLKIQDSIAHQTVNALAIHLGADAEKQLSGRQTKDPEAFRLYMSGRYYWNKRTEANLRKAIEFFERARGGAPEYALAYTGLADCHHLLAEYFAVTPEEGYRESKKYARKAIELDPDLAEAHTSLAYTLAFYDWEWDKAESAFKRAIELNPNYPTARQWYAEFLVAMGRFDEAERQFRTALELDPTSLIIKTDLAALFYIAREFEKAEFHSRQVIELDPEFAYGYVYLWLSMDFQGRRKEGARAFTNAIERFGEKAAAEELRAVLATSAPVEQFWKKRLEQVSAPGISETYSAVWKGMFALRAGDNEAALRWFELAGERRERHAINLRHAPEGDPLRGNPRFESLMKKIGF